MLIAPGTIGAIIAIGDDGRLHDVGRHGSINPAGRVTQTQHARLNSTRPQRVQMSFRRSALEPLYSGQNW